MEVSEQHLLSVEQALSGPKLGRSVGLSHLSWSFDPKSTSKVRGNVTSRSVGPLRISWVQLSMGLKEWGGERTDIDIRSIPEPYLTIVMPILGSIVLTTAGRTTLIEEHELAIWDSTQPLSFALSGSEYEQISVLVPQRVLRAREEVCAALHCSRVDKSNVLSELCIQHMSTLAKFLSSQLRPYEISLSNVTTSLFDAVLASLYKAPRDRDFLLDEMKNYIECYITDESLSPHSVASAFEISTRYAHKLFEHEGATIGEWILRRRLERSANDLVRDEWSITEIAFKWGFKDLGHYSRSFKKRFDKTPSAFRRDVQTIE